MKQSKLLIKILNFNREQKGMRCLFGLISHNQGLSPFESWDIDS